MIIRTVLAALALIALSGAAAAAPLQALVLHTPKDDAVQCLTSDDRMLLLVVDEGTVVARYSYCSSYGRGSAKVYIDERDKRRFYVAIEYGVGRGTSATAYMLKVMTSDDDTTNLRELAEVVLRESDAPDSQWLNEYYALPDIKGGLTITLSYAPGPDGDPCCGPPEKRITIRVVE